MSSRMLIDARHPEETRVAVVKGNRVEEFDFEAAARKQLKGNIYLAKVTRVEPSLQAAFIEYGGNRHGFLAFSEIHPDYYQIPKEDREALLREEQEAARALAEEHHADDDVEQAVSDEDDDDAHEDAPPPPADEHHGDHDPTTESLRKKRMNLRRRYQIQEVIHRRQVMLVQVVKEERGNKGAALTTYLSLAGRYCVLMPNTHNGGGISRKISNQSDRRRLKTIMADLVLPAGMACIVRTAGLQRTRAEIKRDFDYLCRLWDGIRETTLAASAPALIHADSDLLKRAIRDVYSREIEQVLVEGDVGFETAHTFMKQLMPTHAKKVQQYSDAVPLFQRFGVEGQLASMFNPVVQLKSGGYLVINPTEALVAIDINSGRSTREHNIEDTALRTNLEAADEIARQLRLRDMAGLVVIDFIDMEVNGNVRKVEKAMKEALKNDRARIQIGRISSFGLMEMSRQRLRTGILEASSHICPMCDGAGSVRTASSAALGALRGLEEEALRGKNSVFRLRAANDVAVYILNRKRGEVTDLEARYGIAIEIFPDLSLMSPRVEIDASGGPSAKPLPLLSALPVPEKVEEDIDPADPVDTGEGDVDDGEDGTETRPRRDRESDEAGGRRKRRRRRRGGRGDEREGGETPAEGEADAGDAPDADAAEPATATDAEPGEDDGDKPRGDRRRRRRGRRGGRGRAEEVPATEAAAAEVADPEPDVVEAKPAKAPRKSRAKKPVVDVVVETPAAPEPAPEPEPEAAAPPAKPARKPRAKKAVAQDAASAETVVATEPATAVEPASGAGQPRRKGWWQRTFGE